MPAVAAAGVLAVVVGCAAVVAAAGAGEVVAGAVASAFVSPWVPVAAVVVVAVAGAFVDAVASWRRSSRSACSAPASSWPERWARSS